MITQEDIGMFYYFYVEKGDITRWCHWEQKRDAFAKEFPELIAAMNAVTVAQITVTHIINLINDKIEDYPSENVQ